VKYCLEKWGLIGGEDMNRLLELVKRGKAITHTVRGKRETVPGGLAVLSARVGIKNLQWYLADNISDISVRRSK
jgi:hypothetical protein